MDKFFNELLLWHKWLETNSLNKLVWVTSFPPFSITNFMFLRTFCHLILGYIMSLFPKSMILISTEIRKILFLWPNWIRICRKNYQILHKICRNFRSAFLLKTSLPYWVISEHGACTVLHRRRERSQKTKEFGDLYNAFSLNCWYLFTDFSHKHIKKPY